MCGHRPLTASLVLGLDDVIGADVSTYEGDAEMPGTHVTVGIGALVLQPSVDQSLPDVLRALADRIEYVTSQR